MAVLTNADRAAVKESLLREAFEPRFTALVGKINDELRQMVRAEHPVFLELLADDNTREYVAASTNRIIGFYESCDGDEKLRSFLVTVPKQMTYRCSNSPGLLTEYRAIWSDYDKAYRTPNGALMAFKTREKFSEAFPDFAKRLPAPPMKSGLPTIITSNVLADLEAVGVPASK